MNIPHKTVDSISSPLRPRHAPADNHLCNPFTDIRVAITGGTSGLGLSLVRELLDRGAKVALVARSRNRVECVVQELPAAHGIVGDVFQERRYTPHYDADIGCTWRT
jgi:NADPH:quinone reductase-like Zn-dependent oxidoreductase